jgi:parvulin-like peptidyl-prolyl isomerase
MVKFILFFMQIFFLVSSIFATQKIEIVAVVNTNYVISSYDIANRVALLKILNPSLSKTPLNLPEIVLESTINNALLLEANKKFNINLEREDFENQINALLEKLKISFDELKNKAKKAGILEKDFIALLAEDFLLDKIRQSLSFGLTKVSNEEIDSQLLIINSLNNQPEYLLYQISIYNTNSTIFDSITTQTNNLSKGVIDDIYQQLLKGKSFENIAKQFSQDIYAINGGEVGWISSLSLPSKAISVIKKLKIKEYSEPILIDNTYKIYLLKDIRTVLSFNSKDPTHLEQIRQFAKQKAIYEKSQIVLDDFIKDLHNTSTVIVYKKY